MLTESQKQQVRFAMGKRAYDMFMGGCGEDPETELQAVFDLNEQNVNLTAANLLEYIADPLNADSFVLGDFEVKGLDKVFENLRLKAQDLRAKEGYGNGSLASVVPIFTQVGFFCEDDWEKV